jgi:YidC/Oxa1 family membrane protein insertase
MMDKRTLWVVVACIVALFGWQLLINKLYPPRPRPLKPMVPATATNVAPAQAGEVATNVTAEIKQAPPEPEVRRPPEKLVVLSNRFVRVEFTGWGGGIRSVELLKHKANGHGNVVLNSSASVPALALGGLPGAGSNDVFQIEQPDATSIVMRARLATGAEVVKQISLGPDYLLNGNLQVSSSPSGEVTTQNVAIVIGEATPVTPREQQQYFLGVDWLAGGKYQNRALTQLWKNAARGIKGEPVQARWAAVKSQFFAMILTPATDSIAIDYKPVRLVMPAEWSGKVPPDGVSASLEVPPTSVTNGVATYAFTYYAGPKEYDRLVALGKGQEDVMQFGFWGVISIWLLNSMKLLYRLIPNYGIAIIIITILIKLVFWPIQAKSIRSMKEMQKFQPLMNKLREKYKDDPQRLNQEMMKMYKEHKINPFSGCLPMLVQIPVFFALFAMLRSVIELRGAQFLWIKDLSQPDTILTLGGFPLNPLPLLMTGAMIWQQKLTPTTGDTQQAKMMMFMPLIMLWFFYSASSGLCLYWTVQQLLSIAQQWWSLRQPEGTSAPARPLPAGKAK